MVDYLVRGICMGLKCGDYNNAISKRIIRLLIIIYILLTVLNGCGKTLTNNTNESEEITMDLTDRQIEILEYMDLPTEYDKLSYAQQNSINRIENMFEYIEKKYNEHFLFVEYYDSTNITGECLVVCPENGNNEDDFEIRPKEGGDVNEYEDNYLEIKNRSAYSEALVDYFNSKLKSDQYNLFVEISSIDEENEEHNILKYAVATVCLVVDEEALDSNNVDDFLKEYADWMLTNKVSKAHNITIVLVDSGEISNYNYSNYENNIMKEEYLNKKSCAIYSDGMVEIY